MKDLVVLLTILVCSFGLNDVDAFCFQRMPSEDDPTHCTYKNITMPANTTLIDYTLCVDLTCNDKGFLSGCGIGIKAGVMMPPPNCDIIKGDNCDPKFVDENDHSNPCKRHIMDVTVKSIADANFELRLLSADLSMNADKPTLLIFFSWLGAKKRSLEKYFELYHSLGYDVLHIPGLSKHFAWPPTSVQLAITFLEYVCREMCHYRFFVVHSTSIGSYNYTSCLMEISKHPEKYWNFTVRLVGNIFDSITYGSYERMRIGVAYGITKNNLIRILIQQFFALYFILTKSTTVDFYKKGMVKFRDQPISVPTIFYYCRNDPLSDHVLIDEMIELWKKNSMPVLGVCWEESVHAGHLFQHKKEYKQMHNTFLRSVEEYKDKFFTKIKNSKLYL